AISGRSASRFDFVWTISEGIRFGGMWTQIKAGNKSWRHTAAGSRIRITAKSHLLFLPATTVRLTRIIGLELLLDMEALLVQKWWEMVFLDWVGPPTMVWAKTLPTTCRYPRRVSLYRAT